jgi:hypothetical protein
MPGHEASLEDEVEDPVVTSMAGSYTLLRDQGHEIITKNVTAPTKKWLLVLSEQDIKEQLLASLAVKLLLLDHEGPAHLLTTYRT